jgi:Ca-activated chloride channel homolog
LKPHVRLTLVAMAMAGGACAQISGWTTIFLHGKVTMEDGSPPPKAVVIERWCSDMIAPDNVAYTDKNGQYTWKLEFDVNAEHRCNLRAVLAPYHSSQYILPDLNAFSDPNLAPLVLGLSGSNAENVFDEDARVPLGAQTAWGRAQAAARKGRWADAEHSLKAATTAAPKFARGWEALGLVLERENKPAEAWKDYKLAIEADPKLLGPYLPLARLSVEVKDWENAAQVADELIKRDTQKQFAEARLIQAIARYQMQDFDGAVASAGEAIRMDPKNKLPSAENLLGLSLAAKGDYDSARQHLNHFLELMPSVPNIEELKAYIESLGKTDMAKAPRPEVILGAYELPSAGVPGDAWVPGGRKALAQVAGLKDASSYENFFADYCRTLAREMTVGTSQGIPGYLETVRTYMATVTDLLPLGQRNGDTTTVTLSLASDSQRKAAERVLPMLGWKLVSKDGWFTVEPGDQASDGPRQHIPRLFGIDEVSMQETLEAGKSFQFDIPTENARVVGGNDWSAILNNLPLIPGGIAAAFTLDVRVAKTYAGLGAMSPDAASAVIRAVGVRNLVLRDSDVLARYGNALQLSKGSGESKEFVVVPGGAAAEAVWKKLTGANPHEPAAFLRALMEKNEGRLAAFYFAVWSADQAHRDYLTKTEARAERFYAWYRDSDDFKFGVSRHVPGWRTELLQKLPLDAAGDVRFPGGKRAWTTSTAPEDEVITGLKTLDALVPLARMEQRRGSPLDEASVTLLAQHYSEWRSLFPYFEKLPGLGHEEFTSLQAFAAMVSKQPPASQNVVLGEWYSLVELIARGYQAGSLDAAASARAFRSTCEGLSQNDHSAKALATLREIAGGSNLNEAVPSNLLRLSPERRSAFERVLELQSVPRLDLTAAAPDSSKVDSSKVDLPKADALKAMAALSGFVYAAAVNPDGLLISEDTQLLRRHQFTTAEPNDKTPFAFAPAALVGSNTPPGSFLKGGFVNFQEVAGELAPGGRSVPPIALKAPPAPAQSPSGPLLAKAETSPGDGSADFIFHANGRLVEAYATVTDSRGRYVDDLTSDQFTLLDGQKPQTLEGFESHSTPVSVALLLDTTGSMAAALPAVKNAALKLIGDLRPIDSVAVYSFNTSVTELQPFTSDLDQAKRAVLSTQASGETALYDALARVSRDLSGRTGRKVIVVFTDGDDNSSTLIMDTAILRVKAAGVPVYTIAQGNALEGPCHTQERCTNPGSPPAYIKQLADLAKVTGGESFAVRESSEIGAVFEKISEDLAHGYLLVFQPPSAEDHAWHPITVQVRGARGNKVRAREGYYPE